MGLTQDQWNEFRDPVIQIGINTTDCFGSRTPGIRVHTEVQRQVFHSSLIGVSWSFSAGDSGWRVIKDRAVWMLEIVLMLGESHILCIVSTQILVCCKYSLYLRGKLLAELCPAEACWQLREWHNQLSDVVRLLRVSCSHTIPSFKTIQCCCGYTELQAPGHSYYFLSLRQMLFYLIMAENCQKNVSDKR